MQIIGLIGGSGCGKSSVGKQLQALGLEHIDCDKIARQVVEPGTPCLNELVSYFGASILHTDQSLNRAALAKIAFSTPDNTVALNRITHKYILAEIDQQIAQYSSAKGVIVDAAALAESGYLEKCDVVIAVISNKWNRLRRIIRRDQLTVFSAWQRLQAQKANSFYCSYADYVIKNNGSLNHLKKQILDIFQHIFAEN